MNISNSKKQLARIISENGGWRDGAEWAAQGGNRGHVGFASVAPVRNGKVWDMTLGFAGKFLADEVLPNWHQTVLARDEYFHLHPALDADGWIEWKGGECPVPPETLVICRLLGDHEWKGGCPVKAGSMCWDLKGILDIIAYRLHKPERPKSTAVGDDETNLAAKKELEVLEFEPTKPTIEQLASDYKAKMEIAQQAQEVADFRRGEAEAALEKLYQAGLEIGLDIAIASDEDGESELVITDWRDLQVGDEVEVRHYDRMVIGAVCEIDEECRDDRLFRIHEEGGSPWWVTSKEFRFIRRP